MTKVFQLDLSLPTFRRNPYPAYATLRRSNPVSLVRDRGWYAVSRYEDVRQLLERPDIFSSSVMRRAYPALLGADSPEHRATRRLANHAMASAGEMRAVVADASAELAGRAVCIDDWDFVASFAAVLPAIVMARLLGLDATPDELRAWTRSATPRSKNTTPCPGDLQNVAAMEERLSELVRARANHPTRDFVSILLDPMEDGLRLSTDQVRSIAKIVMIGGVETTAHLMGNALVALLQRPDLMASAIKDVDLGGQIIGETVRYDPPVQVVLRRTVRSVRMGSIELSEGTTVGALLGSANRDERAFEHADSFLPDRQPTLPTLAFGRGPHYCLGAHLSKMEATMGLRAVLSSVPFLGPAEDLAQIPMTDSPHLRGPARLMVRSVRSPVGIRAGRTTARLPSCP